MLDPEKTHKIKELMLGMSVSQLYKVRTQTRKALARHHNGSQPLGEKINSVAYMADAAATALESENRLRLGINISPARVLHQYNRELSRGIKV